MADREAKERKLIALMVNDLGPGFGKKEMANLKEEVITLSDSDLDETLAERLDLPQSADEEALEQALSHVEERSAGDPGDLHRRPRHEPRAASRRAGRLTGHQTIRAKSTGCITILSAWPCMAL